MMKLNRLRQLIKDNIDSGDLAIAVPDSNTRLRVELLRWPLQETPSITVLIENMDLEINGDRGILKTVNFTMDHIETDLLPENFYIPEREGFTSTPMSKLQEYLSSEWNEV